MSEKVFILFMLCGSVGAQVPVWVSEGPAPITSGQVENVVPDNEVVGAVHALVAHPTDADILWAGAVNGGIWKTENATARAPMWVRQTDALGNSLYSLSIGAMSLDPTDPTHQTLIAGIGRTSSFFWVGGSRIGVLHTTDGGESWARMAGNGLNNPNITGIAARGSTFVISSNSALGVGSIGMFRSNDGGVNFSRISIGDGSETGLPDGEMTDLAHDPNHPDRLYTVSRNAQDEVNGIFRSDDIGLTWARVSSSEIDGLLAGNVSNAEISVGEHDNVYVAICISGRLAALFRSGNGGTSWNRLDLPSPTIHPGRQAHWHLSIVADPTSPDIVYVGGDRQDVPLHPLANEIGAFDFSGNLFRIDASRPANQQAVHLTHSNVLGPPGGGTASSSAPHADSREMVFDAAGDLIEADDGGVYRRTSPRNNQGDWFSMNGTLATTEFHSIAYDSNANIILGGAQDTGTSFQLGEASRTWTSVSTADGGDVAVDDASTPGFSTRYSSRQFLAGFSRQVWNADNQLLSEEPINRHVVSGPDLRPLLVTPIELNSVNPLRLIIFGIDGPYESFDQGDTIVYLGDAATYQAPAGSDPIAYGAEDNENILYIGSANEVFVRTGPPPEPLVPSETFPGRDISIDVRDIELDRFAGNTTHVLTSAAVYTTVDAGLSWTDITGALASPSFDAGTFHSLAYDSRYGVLFVGTDRGVFQASRFEGFATWRLAGTGLPNTRAFDLDYDEEDRLLVAGLMGRGAWLLELCPFDLTGDQAVDENDVMVAASTWLTDALHIEDHDRVDILDLIRFANSDCLVEK